MRKLAVLLALAGGLFFAANAQAAPPVSVFGGEVSCTTQGPGAYEGQTWCGTGQHNQNIGVRSTVESFDGVPIDVNVAFPPEADAGSGPYPLVYIFHGYGGGKINFPQMDRWLDRGYAVFSQTNRGFHESCGTVTSQAADLDCLSKGFVRLDDTRYEVRDAQIFAGMLVDENLVIPDRIAATGGSYGGGMSMSLAALKDRIMLPDGTYDDWESPNGTPMSLAVAIPDIPWTDLAYSLVPNGSNIDYIEDASYFGPFGVMKQSYVNGLYLSGLGAPGYYTAPGVQPEADLTGWKAFMDLGEPYDGQAAAQQMLDEVTTNHSSYYIDHSQAPAPLLISSGFTDDLFPANEATRYYNRTRAQYPDSPIGLFFGSFGHMRGQNGSEVTSVRTTLQNEWIDFYLKDLGTQPDSDVTTFTQVCPDEGTDAGPFVTDNWVEQSPGEIKVATDGTVSQTIAPTGGSRDAGGAFNPAPSGTACATASGSTEPGTATVETAAAPAGGFTVMGSPTVIGNFTFDGDQPPQVASRLVDVSPDGTTKTLVNRGVTRLAEAGFSVFQLYPNGWHVAEGHKLRLELLPFDGGQAVAAAGLLSNFSRPTNNQPEINVDFLELRIPVREQPGALGGLVAAPSKRVLPDRPGVELAPGNEAIGSQTIEEYIAGELPCPEGTTGTGGADCTPIPCPPGTTGPGGNDCTPNPTIGKVKVLRATVKGKQLTARIRCAGVNDRCAKAAIVFKGAPKRGKGKGVTLARKRGVTVAAGKTATVRFKLTGKARKLFKDTRKRKVIRKRGKKRVKVVKVRGVRKLRTRVLVSGKGSGFVVVKRNGKVR